MRIVAVCYYFTITEIPLVVKTDIFRIEFFVRTGNHIWLNKYFFLSVQIYSYVYIYMYQFHSGLLGVHSASAGGPKTAVERRQVQRSERC